MNVAPDSRRAHSVSWSYLGALSVAFVLALTPTGVNVARADDPEPLVAEAVGPSSVDPALVAGRQPSPSAVTPVCRAGAPQVAELEQRALLRREMLRLQQEIARQAARGPDAARPANGDIVLNGRGYRYGRTGPQAVSR